MATATAIAIRRDAALQRLTAAITSLVGEDVAPFVAPKHPELREVALIEWATDQLSGESADAALVEMPADKWPQWYQKLRAKADEDGMPISPLYEGEGRKIYTARVKAEAESTMAEDVAADAPDVPSAEAGSDDEPYVEAFCQECGVSLGYVVASGHQEWWCTEHSGTGEVSSQPPDIESKA